MPRVRFPTSPTLVGTSHSRSTLPPKRATPPRAVKESLSFVATTPPKASKPVFKKKVAKKPAPPAQAPLFVPPPKRTASKSSAKPSAKRWEPVKMKSVTVDEEGKKHTHTLFMKWDDALGRLVRVDSSPVVTPERSAKKRKTAQ
jgi:hypothetical protein